MTRKELEGLKGALELLQVGLPEGVQQTKAFVEGDHWQNGDGWVGPRPAGDEVGAAEVIGEIERSFVSGNRILEVCDRHASAVLGREPTWTLVPREEFEEPLEDDHPLLKKAASANRALTAWWNKRGVPTILLDAVVAQLWGKRSTLRLYVPAGVREEEGRANAESLEAALDMIWLEAVPADKATVHEDPTTKRLLGIVAFKNAKDEDVVELSYLDDTGENTLVEVVTSEGTDMSDPLAMGGRITMHQLSRSRPLVSPQMRQQQRAHNLALSMLPRNLVTGGFLQQVIVNAQMPGRTVVDGDGNEQFIAERLKLGAGTTTFLAGLESEDRTTGTLSRATPSIHWREPVPVDSSVNGAVASYQTMLEEARQSYVLLNTAAGASGKSRVEARKDFDTSLRPTRLEVERAGRWLIETVLAVAQNFYSEEYTEELRADFTCIVDPGTATPEERAQNSRDVEAGIMPKDMAQRAMGIDDTDAAQATIEAEPEVQVRLIQRRVAVFAEATGAGMDAETAAVIAGFDEEDVKLIAAGATFVEPGDNDDAPPPQGDDDA
jgi:hypothetical protein